MSKYLAELKPIGSFFFGGERTQRDGDSLKNNIVSSNIFPQQTSILGMLRKKVLMEYAPELYKDKGNYSDKEDREKIADIIGTDSFQNIYNNEVQDFKIIKKISPVILSCRDRESKKRNFLIPMPKDHKLSSKDKNGSEVENKCYTPFKINHQKSKLRVSYGDDELSEVKVPISYNSKQGISKDFLLLDESKSVVKFDELYKCESNIGINLRGVHKTDDNGLFRINRYRFYETIELKDREFNDKKFKNIILENIKFAFIVEFDDKYKPKDKSIVNLGGEGTSFIFEINELKQNNLPNISEILKEDISDDKIVLLSDTILKYEEYSELCSYAISTIQEFRCLSFDFNKVNDKRYSNRFTRTKKKYSLLGRGSVLYPKKEKYTELKEAIEKYKNMNNIGYNHIIGGGK